MSYFDEVETAALDAIIAQDFEPATLYRYISAPQNDGFNAEMKHEATSTKRINIAIARSADDWIGTTDETDIQMGDVIEIINDRGKRRRYAVTNFEPTTNHTLLTMSEARNG